MKTSNTAIEQYIRCPKQYNEERHNKNRGIPVQTMLSGRVIHRTIDKLLTDHRNNGKVDYLDISVANEIFTEQWSIEPGLHDKNLFTSGLQMIHDLIEDLGVIDPSHIIGTEKTFSIRLDDESEMVGIIDLILGIEHIDEETGECFFDVKVIDWKTTQSFTSQRDADESLQLSIYLMAARQMFPEATSYTAALHMLAERNHLTTKRSLTELQEDAMFIKATIAQIENDKLWRPIANPSCIYCHLRKNCDAYQRILNGPTPTMVEDETDLENLAEERNKISLLKKLAENRKKEIDEIFMAHLRSTGMALELGDHFFKITNMPRNNYPTLKTCRLLTKRLKLSFDTVVSDICSVGTTKLKDMIKNYTGGEDTRMTQAALANIVETTYSQRIYYKKAKPHKKAKK